MVEQKNDEWVRGEVFPGLDPVGHWIHLRNGVGLPGRRTAILFRLTEGDLAGFIADWEAFARAVADKGGLPPGNDDTPPVTREELVGGIEPPLPFEGLPPDDGRDGKEEGYEPVPPEEVVHSLTVGRGFFALLTAGVEVGGIADPRGRLNALIVGTDLPAGAVVTQAESLVGSGGGNPDGVITAVIDGGLPLAHARFRSGRTATRIEWAWIMRPKPPGGGGAIPGPVLSKGDIDTLLGQCDIGGQVDEDLFYQRTGQADFGLKGQNELGYAVTHGAHVMDLACGRDADDPLVTGDLNPIICVQLPDPVTADTSGQSLEPYVKQAFDFIRAKAQAISVARGGGSMKLVVNFSYGLTAGSHDGHGPMESAIEQFIQTRPRTTVILPSGNRYMSQCHVMLEKDRIFHDHRQTLTWRIQPDDRTDSFMEFWMPSNVPPSGSRLTMTLTPPGGAPTSLPIDETDGLVWEWRPLGLAGPMLARIGYFKGTGPAAKGSFHLITAGSLSLDDPGGVAPSGDWKIEIEDTGLDGGEVVHGWIQRDDAIYPDFAAGRQSYFIDPAYDVVNPPGVTPEGGPSQTDNADTPVQKRGLMSALATGKRSIAVAGFTGKSGVVALYSAGGPTLNPLKPAPDAMAASDTSRVHPGTIAAASRSGAISVMGGTSMAAPRLARKAAEAMQAGPTVTRAIVEGWAGNPPPPDDREGFGAIATATGRQVKRIDLP